MAATERRSSVERRASAGGPAINTALLLRVEVPATGFGVLLNFDLKPGSLQQVQQGITEVIEELGYRLQNLVNEKDLRCAADKYEVAKLECEQQLQDWQSKLSEAAMAVMRADRNRNELSNIREAYFREVQSLREQLYQKQQAEEQGQEFAPDIIDLFNTKKEDKSAELLEEMERMEEERKAEIGTWKQRNADLVEKLKSKVLQASLQSELVAQVLDDAAAAEAAAPTVCNAEVQTVEPKRKDTSAGTDPVVTSCSSIQTEEAAPVERAEMEVQTDFEDAATQGKSPRSKGRPKVGGKQKARTKSTESAEVVVEKELQSPPELPVDLDRGDHVDRASQTLDLPTASVSTQVDPMQLTPVTPRTPKGTPSPRGSRLRQRAETVEDAPAVADPLEGSDSDSGISNCLLETWPAEEPQRSNKLPTLTDEQLPSSPRRGTKKQALTLPTQDDIAGKEILFAVSSHSHSAVMASVSDGARPAKRVISRPRLSSSRLLPGT